MPTHNPKQIKIAFFHLAFLYSGGGEKLVLKEIELLKNLGYQVDCYAPFVDERECFPDIIKKAKIKEIIPLFSKLFRRKPEIGVLLTCLFFPLISYKYKKYDIVMAANQPSGVLGFFLQLQYKIPYVVYLAQPTRLIYPRPIDKKLGMQLKNRMTLFPHVVNILRPLFFWIDLKSISCANVFLCNGIYMQDILGQIYGRKPIVCHAGAFALNFQNIQNKNNNNIFQFREQTFSKPYIFLSNRHFPHKKFEYALEILDSMETKIPLLISGEHTSYTEELKDLTRYYRLERYVYFLGYCTEKELSYLYRNCSAYIYTAPEEDFGMGIVEAMGYGKPVVAWDNSGPSKIIKHKENGFLAQLNDITSMKQHLEECINNTELTMKISKNAVNTIKRHYSWKNHQTILHTKIQDTISIQLLKKQRNIVLDKNLSAISFRNLPILFFKRLFVRG